MKNPLKVNPQKHNRSVPQNYLLNQIFFSFNLIVEVMKFYFSFIAKIKNHEKNTPFQYGKPAVFCYAGF